MFIYHFLGNRWGDSGKGKYYSYLQFVRGNFYNHKNEYIDIYRGDSPWISPFSDEADLLRKFTTGQCLILQAARF